MVSGSWTTCSRNAGPELTGVTSRAKRPYSGELSTTVHPPAHAGGAWESELLVTYARVYPRVRGAARSDGGDGNVRAGSSPFLRGCP